MLKLIVKDKALKTLKTIISFSLSALIILTFVPLRTDALLYVNNGEASNYNQLETLLKNSEIDTVKITGDFELTYSLDVLSNSGKKIIDLNGHIIDSNGFGFKLSDTTDRPEFELIITDTSTNNNGTIKSDKKTALYVANITEIDLKVVIDKSYVELNVNEGYVVEIKRNPGLSSKTKVEINNLIAKGGSYFINMPATGYSFNVKNLLYKGNENNKVRMTSTTIAVEEFINASSDLYTDGVLTPYSERFSNLLAFEYEVKETGLVNKFKVIFYDNENNVLDEIIVDEGANATDLAPTPPKVYPKKFVEWDKDITNIQSNMMVYPIYKNAPAYTVYFRDKDNNIFYEVLGYQGFGVEAPPAPKFRNWEFVKWITDFSNIQSSLDVYSEYKKLDYEEYIVEYYDFDGNLFYTEYVKDGDDAVFTGKPEKEGYIFEGWTPDRTFITEDLKVYPEFTKEYIVTFFDKDGVAIFGQYVREGTDAQAPPVPEYEGYTFIGWDKSFENVTEDLKIYATYEINKYTVTFRDLYDDIIEEVIVEHGKKAIAPTPPEFDGYVFREWSENFDSVKNSMEVKALYDNVYKDKYIVKFVDKDGYELMTVLVNIGYDLTKTPFPPYLDGYLFVGWDNDLKNISEDLVVKPVYIPNDENKLTVVFLGIDEFWVKIEHVKKGMDATPPVLPEVEGMVLVGWNKDYTNVQENLVISPVFEEKKVDPVEPDKPADPGKPVDPSKPIDPGKPIEPEKPEETVYTYAIISKLNTKFNHKNAKDIKLKIDADHNKLLNLKLNGIVIDIANYKVSEGSTVIQVFAKYLNTLAVGTHELCAQFDEKTVCTDIEVLAIKETLPSAGLVDYTLFGSGLILAGYLIILYNKKD